MTRIKDENGRFYDNTPSSPLASWSFTYVSSKPNTKISLKRQRELLRTINLQTFFEIYVFDFDDIEVKF